jgi:hypothetical protein
MRRVGDGELFGAFPFLIKLSADGGDQGSEFRSAMSRFWRASMSSQATDFVALLKRRIVERTSMARSMSTSGQGAGMPSVTRRSPPRLAYSHSCCENDVITQNVLGQILWKMGRSDNCDIKLTWLGINTVL